MNVINILKIAFFWLVFLSLNECKCYIKAFYITLIQIYHKQLMIGYLLSNIIIFEFKHICTLTYNMIAAIFIFNSVILFYAFYFSSVFASVKLNDYSVTIPLFLLYQYESYIFCFFHWLPLWKGWS